jgi:hypothetical protein
MSIEKLKQYEVKHCVQLHNTPTAKQTAHARKQLILRTARTVQQGIGWQLLQHTSAALHFVHTASQ